MELVFKINIRRLIWYTISYTMRFFLFVFFHFILFFIFVFVFFNRILCSNKKFKCLGYSSTFWMDIDLENRFRSLIIYNNNFIMSLFLCFFNFYFYFLIIYLVSFPHNDAPVIFQTVVVGSAQVIHSVTRWWWFC